LSEPIGKYGSADNDNKMHVQINTTKYRFSFYEIPFIFVNE